MTLKRYIRGRAVAFAAAAVIAMGTAGAAAPPPTPAPAPATVVLVVLDLSGSVDTATAVRAGLEQVVDELPARTWIGLIGVNNGFRSIVSPTRDRAALQREIEAITPSGYPGLLDHLETIESIAGQVRRAGQVDVAVVAITDSDAHDYRSNYGDQRVNSSDQHDLSRRFPGRDLQSKLQRMNRRLEGDQAPLYVVQTSPRGDTLNRLYNNGLQRFCATLGGDSWFAQSRAEIPLDIEAAFEAAGRY